MTRFLTPARLTIVGGGVLVLGSAALHALGHPRWGSTLGALALLAVIALVLELRRSQRTLHREVRTQSQAVRRALSDLAARSEAPGQREDAARDLRRVLSALARAQQEVRASRDELAGTLEPLARTAKETLHEVHAVARDVEASTQLRELLRPRAPLPPTGGWAIDAHSMLQITDLVLRERPARVVELGSGSSTVWLGYVVEQVGGRLVSIDHLPEYAALTHRTMQAHELQGTVEVRTAGLAPTDLGAAEGPGATTDERRWYGLDAFEDQQEIDLLIVDGPPSSVGPQARYPAVPVLVGRLADEAWVVLDDARRKDEKAVAARWLAEVPGLERVTTSSENLCLLRYVRPTPAAGRAPLL